MGRSVLNGARLDAIATSFRALFFQSLENNKNALAAKALPFMMEVPSTGSQNNYNWFGSIPGFQEWISDRSLERLRAAGFALLNKEWATGLIIDANDIEDDNLGMIRPRIDSLSDAYFLHIFKKFIELIENGAATACYDGQNFFSASHSEGASGTQSNYASSGALTADTFETKRAAMMELKDDRGELLGIVPNILWGGTSLEGTMDEIVTVGRLASGADNPNKGKCTPVVLPGLASSTMWGLADTTKPLKPFVKQDRRPISFTALTDPESPDFFHRRECLFGVDYRGNYGYAMWQLMFMSTGT